MDNTHFTPPQLAPLFGVNVSTIKRWADRGYLPSERTSGGHRRISSGQLEQFIAAHPRHAKNSYVLKRLHRKDFCPDDNCWKEYYRYLKNDQHREALALLERLYLQGTRMIDLLRVVVTPTMRKIGAEWSQENISVYEEHRMSFHIRAHLIRIEQYIPDKTTKSSPNAILACAPGEYHELPLQLVSIIYKLQGWKTHSLGVNISADELIRAAKKIKPQVITISKTYTKKEAPSYFKKLVAYTEKNNICFAFGGGAWKKEFNKNFWQKRKCAKYFPALKLFDEYLANYLRR